MSNLDLALLSHQSVNELHINDYYSYPNMTGEQWIPFYFLQQN
ncbi:hypothetical protein PMIT1313_02113 [Prochlorococcus marinus str. MIT 1313]|nr:hypothetical protein PMIT1313_02113 [Prochlorococcus marinus str. MIT 1313]KZR71272.1 hypothetical protein PMIT1318_02415 [Prochlorococcus marinus str. MIT 1318]